MLIWIFGAVDGCAVHVAEPTRTSGVLELQHASVEWLLSIDARDLPAECSAAGQTTYRSMTIDDEEVEFSSGFTDLHTAVYEEILAGKGFGIRDALPSIQLVHDIREARVK
jgi:UDP-N-acetyl-2-amino-2-deoxyglucuronate dehydrogenase